MVSSLSGFFKENRIGIGDGHFLILDTPVLPMPVNTVILLQKILVKKHGKEFSDLFYHVGRLQARSTIAKEIDRNSLRKNVHTLNKYLKLSELIGGGRLKLLKFSEEKKKVVFENLTCPYCRQYHKLFGFVKHPVNDFMRGFCTGLAEEILEIPLIGLSTSSYVQKHNRCLIEVKAKWDKKRGKGHVPSVLGNEEKLYGLLKINTAKNYGIGTPKHQTLVTQRVLGHQQMEFSDGHFCIWKMPGQFFNANAFSLLHKLCNENLGDEINHALYHLGRIQAINAVSIQVEHFGVKADEKLLDIMIGQMEFMGIGKMEASHFDGKKKEAVIVGKNSLFPVVYREVFGKQKQGVDHYLRGLMTGTCQELFKTPVIGIELKSPVLGNKFSEFVIKEKRQWVKEDKVKKNSFPRNIIDEKLLYKNMTIKAFMAP